MTRLPLNFYLRNDVVEISRDLLGKVLCSNEFGQITKAIIMETEAYSGINDKASHAYGGRRTARTAPMYRQGGTAYVYLCYGIHHLFNVVGGDVDVPLAAVASRSGSVNHPVREIPLDVKSAAPPPFELMEGAGNVPWKSSVSCARHSSLRSPTGTERSTPA